MLPYYDTGSWSLYGVEYFTGSYRGPGASIYYQREHVRQLRWLYSLTGDPVFKKYADLFESYL